MLNPVWLTTFRTLVEIGHFTQTAEKLHMTQPGVSQHIRKLEQACGHMLLRREGKGFELTEQGRSVYQYAIELQQKETELLIQLGADEPHSGLCRLACSGAMAMELYPALLDMQVQHPGLTIELEAAPNQRILQHVSEGTIDLGLVTSPPTLGLYEVEPLGFETLSLILPDMDSTVPGISDRLHALGLIDHPDALHYLELYCSRCGIPQLENLDIHQLPKVGYINQLHQILLPVAKGIGFTVLPQPAIHNFPHKDRLVIHTPAQAVKQPLYLIGKRNRKLPVRFEAIRQLIREATCFSNKPE